MFVVFSPIFVANTEIIFGDNSSRGIWQGEILQGSVLLIEKKVTERNEVTEQCVPVIAWRKGLIDKGHTIQIAMLHIFVVNLQYQDFFFILFQFVCGLRCISLKYIFYLENIVELVKNVSGMFAM